MLFYMEVNLEDTQLYSWPGHTGTCSVYIYLEKFIIIQHHSGSVSNLNLQPLDLNNRFEIRIIKMKKQNLSDFNSAILYDDLEFLFLLKI